MELYLSPLAKTFIRKNVRSLGLVLTVENNLWRMTPYRDYSFFIGAHEEFTRIYDEEFIIVMPDYLSYNLPKLHIGLFHNDRELVIVGKQARSTLIDRRWHNRVL